MKAAWFPGRWGLCFLGFVVGLIFGIPGAWAKGNDPLAVTPPDISGIVAGETQAIDPNHPIAGFEGDRSFDFCHTARQLGVSEATWCEMLDELSAPCPKLRESCGLQPYVDDTSEAPTLRERGLFARKRRGNRQLQEWWRTGRDEQNESESESFSFELPGFGAFSLLAWLALGAILVVVCVAIARMFGNGMEASDEIDETVERLRPRASDKERPPPESEIPVEVITDVQRLLSGAREAAEQGRYNAATEQLMAAVIRDMEGRGLIEVEQGRTNGDYLRALEPRDPARTLLGPLVGLVDRIQFGRAESNQATFESHLRATMELLKKTLGGLVLALGLGGMACGFGPKDAGEGSQAAAESSTAFTGLGSGPLGNRGFALLLEHDGLTVHHRPRTIAELAESSGTVMLLDDVMLYPDEWDELLEWVEAGGDLVVLANGTEPERLGIRRVASTTQDHQLTAWDLGADKPLQQRVVAPAWAQIEMIAPDDTATPQRDPAILSYWNGLRRGEEALRQEIHYGEGRLTIFADGFLFTNASLRMAENAQYIRQQDIFINAGEVELVSSFRSAGARSLGEVLVNAELMPLFVQGLAFALVLFISLGAAFARLREPGGHGRRAFVEHVEALARRLAQTGDRGFCCRAYCAWAWGHLRARAPWSPEAGAKGLAQALHRTTGRSEAELIKILQAADEVRRGLGSGTPPWTGDRLVAELARLIEGLGKTDR